MSTPVNVKKLGHVVFTVSDIERSTKFWTDIMGFHVSDRNEIGMVFLRNASDHHTTKVSYFAPGATPIQSVDSPAGRPRRSHACTRERMYAGLNGFVT